MLGHEVARMHSWLTVPSLSRVFLCRIFHLPEITSRIFMPCSFMPRFISAPALRRGRENIFLGFRWIHISENKIITRVSRKDGWDYITQLKNFSLRPRCLIGFYHYSAAMRNDAISWLKQHWYVCIFLSLGLQGAYKWNQLMRRRRRCSRVREGSLDSGDRGAGWEGVQSVPLSSRNVTFGYVNSLAQRQHCAPMHIALPDSTEIVDRAILFWQWH